jgi:DNA-binding transcriptional LysR family regulator
LDARLKTETLFWREDVAICGYGHPLAAQEDLTLPEMVQHTMLFLEKGSTSRLLIEQRLAQQGLIPKATMDVGSIEIVKRLAEINLGVAIVPGVAQHEEQKFKRLRVFRLDWLQPRAVGLLQRRNGYLSPASTMFLKLFRHHVPNVLLCPLV